MYLIPFLIACGPKKYIPGHPITMSPQQQLSVDESQNGAEGNLPFPKEQTPDEVLQDNTNWFADISLLNATAQNEKGEINVTWEETPDTSTKFLMIKIQRSQDLSWEELAGLPPTIQFDHQSNSLPFTKVSVYNHKDKIWETYAAPKDQTLTLTEIYTYLENQLFLLLHMKPLPESEKIEEGNLNEEMTNEIVEEKKVEEEKVEEKKVEEKKVEEKKVEEKKVEEKKVEEKVNAAITGEKSSEKIKEIGPSPKEEKIKEQKSNPVKGQPFVDRIILGNQEYRSAGSTSDNKFSEFPTLSNLKRFDVETLAELPGEFSMEEFCSPIGDQGLIPADTAFAVLDGSVKCQIGLQDHYKKTGWTSAKIPSLLDFYIHSGMKNSKKVCSSSRTWSDIIPNYDLMDNEGLFESTIGVPYDKAENWTGSGFEQICKDRMNTMFPKGSDVENKKTSNTPTNVYGITFKNIHVLPNDMTIYRKLLVMGNPLVITMPVMDLELSEDFRASYFNFPTEKKHLHSMVIVGYSDQKQAFRVRNSWGTDFADGGYFWLSYKLTRDLMEKNLFDGILFHLEKLNDVIVLGGDEDTGAEYDVSKVLSRWSSDGTQLLHQSLSPITLEDKEYAPDDNGVVRLPKEKLTYLTKMQKDDANIYLFVPELLNTPHLYFHFRSDLYSWAHLDFALTLEGISMFPRDIESITLIGHQDTTSFENPTNTQKSLSERRIEKALPLIKIPLTVNKVPKGNTDPVVAIGDIKSQAVNRFVSLDVKWKQAAFEMDEAGFKKFVQNGKEQKQKLISGDEILPDWRGLTKKEVNQQLRLYGVNPSDTSWFLDEKSSAYLPPEHPARIKYRRWYREWSKSKK